MVSNVCSILVLAWIFALEHVFLLNCSKSHWAKRHFSNFLQFDWLKTVSFRETFLKCIKSRNLKSLGTVLISLEDCSKFQLVQSLTFVVRSGKLYFLVNQNKFLCQGRKQRDLFTNYRKNESTFLWGLETSNNSSE